jgi:hypothetical protein
MPEAVRISVSIRSFSTWARAGKALCSSAGVADRQVVFGEAPKEHGKARNKTKAKRPVLIGNGLI